MVQYDNYWMQCLQDYMHNSYNYKLELLVMMYEMLSLIFVIIKSNGYN
jgi:hypothetical protein